MALSRDEKGLSKMSEYFERACRNIGISYRTITPEELKAEVRYFDKLNTLTAEELIEEHEHVVSRVNRIEEILRDNYWQRLENMSVEELYKEIESYNDSGVDIDLIRDRVEDILEVVERKKRGKTTTP
jgi:uncharacterized circularly permuted ATP-grasp superfamily protein